MKTANAILTELVEACQPPPRCTIVMTETIPDETDERNWLVARGPMENTRKAALFSSKVAELRLTEPTIDWSDAETMGGKGLIAHRDRSLQEIVCVAIGKIWLHQSAPCEIGSGASTKRPGRHAINAHLRHVAAACHTQDEIAAAVALSIRR